MGLEGRFKWCYGRIVSERVRLDCFSVMVLDRRRRLDQKTRGERLEDEGIEYRQTNGASETEHTAG